MPTGHDVIVSPPPGVASFLSGMHDFRDNEVLLQAAYDVIVILPPGGV